MRLDESDFLLQAVTTPTLSYDQNTGTDVEIQLSNDADWRSESDEAWHFNVVVHLRFNGHIRRL